MSIYRYLLELEKRSLPEDEEDKDEFRLLLSNIRKQLVHKKPEINKTESGYFTVVSG
jgi:hypothetical protein